MTIINFERESAGNQGRQKTLGRQLIGDLTSYEPYGIMYTRDDPGLEAVVARALRELAASREISHLYNRWFLRPLPSGGRIGLPMSPQLRRSFGLLGMPSD